MPPQSPDSAPVQPSPLPAVPWWKSKSVVLSGVVLIVLAVGGYFAYRGSLVSKVQDQPQGTTTPDVLAQTAAEKADAFAEAYWAEYYARFVYPKYEIATIQTYDGPYDGIVGIDAEGKKHELVPVQVLSRPTTSEWTFYYSFKPGTDAGAGPYFGHNSRTGQLTFLKTTGEYIENWYPDKKKISPDGLSMLSAYHWSEPDKEGVLHKIDLTADTVTTVHTLAQGETFIEDFSGLGAAANSTIEWVDDHTVRYKVYTRLVDPTKSGGGPYVNPYLRTEMLDLNTGKTTVL